MVVASGAEDEPVPRIVYVNAAAAALIGRSVGELLDQPMNVLGVAGTDALDLARLVEAARRRDGRRLPRDPGFAAARRSVALPARAARRQRAAGAR
jgi:PAS domain-containing protein